MRNQTYRSDERILYKMYKPFKYTDLMGVLMLNNCDNTSKLKLSILLGFSKPIVRDQTAPREQSDHGLFCLRMSFLLKKFGFCTQMVNTSINISYSRYRCAPALFCQTKAKFGPLKDLGESSEWTLPLKILSL